MNTATIMLIAITATSIVGGAFAYNGTTLGSTRYCYSITEVEPPVGECNLTTVNASCRMKLPQDLLTYYYTTTNDVTKCEFAHCPNVGVCDQQ